MADYLSNSEQEVKEYSDRFQYIYYAFGIIILIIFSRLWYLQIIKGSILRKFSEKNRIKEHRIQAARGVILDRNGEILINNLPGFVATMTPQYTTHLKETSSTIGRILDIPSEKIIKKVKKSKRQNGPFLPVKIKENLSREEVFRLKLIRLKNPGLEIQNSIIRNYPLNENGAQLFGYVAEVSRKQLPLLNKKHKDTRFYQGDLIGKRGLEKIIDMKIRGKDGVSYLEVDARGRELAKNSRLSQVFSTFNPLQPAQSGTNIQLTIDKDIQEAAYKAFAGRERVGSVVAINPKGEVLAWISTPSFDPNVFSRGIPQKIWSKLLNDPYKPLRNKVIQDHTPPGSTFKPFIAIAALEENLITPKTKIFCPGYIKLGRKKYHCGSKHGHGEVDVYQAIERSCNVFFYRIGAMLGIDRIAKYAKAFGLGKKTQIDLLNEKPGLIPSSQWKLDAKGEKWHGGETLSASIGQGYVLANPLQLALAFSALGKSDYLYKPFIVKNLLDSNGKITSSIEPQISYNYQKSSSNEVTISQKNFAVIKEGLRLVNNGSRGTAQWWKVPGIQMAGKTGTAQFFSSSAENIYKKCENKPFNQRYHGWYVGYAPHDNPAITVAVLSEHGCHGGSASAPVARDIIEAYFKKYPLNNESNPTEETIKK